MEEIQQILQDSLQRQDEEQRRYFGRAPKAARQVIARVMQQKGYAQLQVQSELQSAWRTVVGEQLSQQTRVGRIRKGVLDVFVGNSVVLQELTFQKHQLLSQLRSSDALQVKGKNNAIHDIRFHSGPMT